MAKRPERKIIDDDLFAKTAPQTDQTRQGPGEAYDLDKGPTISTGLGLRKGELEAGEKIAGELGISRNLLLRFAIRYVLTEYLAGRLDLHKWVETPPEPKRTMRMP